MYVEDTPIEHQQNLMCVPLVQDVPTIICPAPFLYQELLRRHTGSVDCFQGPGITLALAFGVALWSFSCPWKHSKAM